MVVTAILKKQQYVVAFCSLVRFQARWKNTRKRSQPPVYSLALLHQYHSTYSKTIAIPGPKLQSVDVVGGIVMGFNLHIACLGDHVAELLAKSLG